MTLFPRQFRATPERLDVIGVALFALWLVIEAVDRLFGGGIDWLVVLLLVAAAGCVTAAARLNRRTARRQPRREAVVYALTGLGCLAVAGALVGHGLVARGAASGVVGVVLLAVAAVRRREAVRVP